MYIETIRLDVFVLGFVEVKLLNLYVVLDFWKIREKQLLEFYEQINQKQIGDFLIVTKSPALDVYRKIIATAVTGK